MKSVERSASSQDGTARMVHDVGRQMLHLHCIVNHATDRNRYCRIVEPRRNHMDQNKAGVCKPGVVISKPAGTRHLHDSAVVPLRPYSSWDAAALHSAASPSNVDVTSSQIYHQPMVPPPAGGNLTAVPARDGVSFETSNLVFFHVRLVPRGGCREYDMDALQNHETGGGSMMSTGYNKRWIPEPIRCV